MLRNILAAVAGYATMAILVIVVTFGLAIAVPVLRESFLQQVAPPNWYMVVNLAYGAVFAAVGGWVTATIAKGTRMAPVLALAIVAFVFGILQFFLADAGVQPAWYQIVLIVIVAPSILIGGHLGARRAAETTSSAP